MFSIKVIKDTRLKLMLLQKLIKSQNVIFLQAHDILNQNNYKRVLLYNCYLNNIIRAVSIIL